MLRRFGGCLRRLLLLNWVVELDIDLYSNRLEKLWYRIEHQSNEYKRTFKFQHAAILSSTYNYISCNVLYPVSSKLLGPRASAAICQ